MSKITCMENLQKHVRILSVEIGSRHISEQMSLKRASDYITNTFTDIGYQVQKQPYNAFGIETENIIAYNLDSKSEPVLLLGAHYDTVPGTPGADDNASGVAVMLETARILSEQEKSPTRVIFTGFSTEEPPSFNTSVMGSRVFVSSLKETGIRVEGALILEMVGYYRKEKGSQQIPISLKWLGFSDTGDFIMLVGNGRSRKLIKEMESAFSFSGSGLPVETINVPGNGYILPETRLSDNASFWDAGIPAAMITDTSFFRNPNYHQHTDRIETLDFESMEKLVRCLVSYLSGEKVSA